MGGRASSTYSTLQRTFQIGDQIFRRFDTARETKQIRRHLRARALGAGAVVYQAFDPAQRGRTAP